MLLGLPDLANNTECPLTFESQINNEYTHTHTFSINMATTMFGTYLYKKLICHLSEIQI